ncbi:MAG: phenylalanine--tRNA ligase subunit alpha [Nitrospirota bacterium]|nr:phenylalanine--tRNA ligase subunit alpha [Nitrospirota bacterium]
MSLSLHPLERALLRPFVLLPDRSGFLSQSELEGTTALESSQIQMGVEWLKAKSILSERIDRRETVLSLTDSGEEALAEGLSEERIVALLSEGPQTMNRLRELFSDPSIASKAVGALKESETLRIGEGGMVYLSGELPSSLGRLRELLAQIASSDLPVVLEELPEPDRDLLQSYQRKRGKGKGLLRFDERSQKSYQLSPDCRLTVHDLDEAESLLGAVTPEMLQNKTYEGKTFRPYSLETPPPRPDSGRLHPYREFLDEVRGHLVRLGFSEMTGSLVEPEFWNMDALFIPQTHPARNIHDIYLLKEPKTASDHSSWPLDAVARTHEGRESSAPTRGWRQPFDPLQSRRLLMRSQGTALSARTLAESPDIPGKYFAIARCFRHDQVDATHAVDFFQAEGIVLEKKANFRMLLGLLELLAREIAGVDQVHYKPAYFPFTEPSVELHAHHPELGWMELGGAGLFRPEVTRPLGINVPVIAWGMGIDRMAMFRLGLSDIRDLFTGDLSVLSEMTRSEEISHSWNPFRDQSF